jgi:hypothetical protein
MYTESEFMDMSLASRRAMISQEIAKLVAWAIFSYLNN